MGFGFVNGKIKLCNHSIGTDKSTLVFRETMTFTNPEVKRAVCKCCKRSFNFIKDENSNLRIYKGE